MVEQETHKLLVGSSNLPLGTTLSSLGHASSTPRRAFLSPAEKSLLGFSVMENPIKNAGCRNQQPIRLIRLERNASGLL